MIARNFPAPDRDRRRRGLEAHHAPPERGGWILVDWAGFPWIFLVCAWISLDFFWISLDFLDLESRLFKGLRSTAGANLAFSLRPAPEAALAARAIMSLSQRRAWLGGAAAWGRRPQGFALARPTGTVPLLFSQAEGGPHAAGSCGMVTETVAAHEVRLGRRRTN